MLLMIIKSIKANYIKIGEYNGILSDKAKEFLTHRILSTSWYPFEVYRELYDALCLIEARNDPKILEQWGIIESKRMFSTTYQSIAVKEDLQMAIEGYTRFQRRIFNFGDIIFEFISDNEVMFSYKDMPLDWENFYYTAVGYLKGFLELCVDKKVDSSFLKKSWKGESSTEIKISWSL